MTFNKELKELAYKYQPDFLVDVGDIVSTIWSNWKRRHDVMICEFGVEMVKLRGRARKEGETVSQWLEEVQLIGIQPYYLALRLKKDGTPGDAVGSGIVLSNFTSKNGTWNRIYESFNHCGLSWAVDRMDSSKERSCQ